MRKLIIAAGLVGLAAGTATAAEFQPIGTLGMGGAGVARNMGAYASYWNPAGLAFADKAYSTTVGGGVGLRVSEGLADNVDRLAKFSDNNVINNLENLAIPPPPTISGPKAVADTVNLLTVLNDLKTEKGTLSLNIDAAAGFQVKQFGFGLFVLTEGFGQTLPDINPATQALRNVLPLISGVAATPAQLAILSGAAPGGYSPTIMSATQRDQMATSLGISQGEANNIINAVETNLAATSNVTPISANQAANTLTNTLVGAFNSGGTIDNNNTAVMVKNVAFAEVPIAYGHAFDFGKLGKMGIGGALKVVRGRVYQSRIRLTENGESVTSSDITNALKDNHEESTNVTFDLGAQYKYSDWLTAGIVAKNLTSPAFKSPELKDQKDRVVDVNGVVEGQPGFAGRHRDEDVQLKPQARLGVAFDPYSWLTIAADLDLTENEAVLAGLDFKSRHFGGGVEFHTSWIKGRVGIYKNLANTEIGPVATAGITIGIPWVLLEVDGAYGLDKARYKDKDYPKEARVQTQLTVQF